MGIRVVQLASQVFRRASPPYTAGPVLTGSIAEVAPYGTVRTDSSVPFPAFRTAVAASDFHFKCQFTRHFHGDLFGDDHVRAIELTRTDIESLVRI